MKILVIGIKSSLEEIQQKFGNAHVYTLVATYEDVGKAFGTSEVVFDFAIGENPSQIGVYKNFNSGVTFLNTSMTSLSKIGATDIPASVFGFCGMPTFVNREILEVSMRRETDHSKLKQVCDALNTKYEIVPDRVGMVTPRVICMIINEAYYTVQEGIATREDTDMAMKLGTNYPFGPFEWAARIGIRNVCGLLNAMHQETGNGRYKICPLMMSET